MKYLIVTAYYRSYMYTMVVAEFEAYMWYKLIPGIYSSIIINYLKTMVTGFIYTQYTTGGIASRCTVMLYYGSRLQLYSLIMRIVLQRIYFILFPFYISILRV